MMMAILRMLLLKTMMMTRILNETNPSVEVRRGKLDRNLLHHQLKRSFRKAHS